MSNELGSLRRKHEDGLVRLDEVEQRKLELEKALERIEDDHTRAIEQLRLDHEQRLRVKEKAFDELVARLHEEHASSLASLCDQLREASAADPQRLMLVGHNPGMHELALALADRGDTAGRKALAHNLPTSGLAVFDFAVDDWADVAFRRGRLVLFVTPKLLKQTSDD